IELEEMPVSINLRRLKIRIVVVVPLAGQGPIHAVIDIAANDQWILQIVIGPDRRFFFMKYVDQSIRIDHRRLLPLCLGDLNRQFNEVHVKVLASCILRSEAQDAVLSRLGLVIYLIPIYISADHLQHMYSTLVLVY